MTTTFSLQTPEYDLAKAYAEEQNLRMAACPHEQAATNITKFFRINWFSVLTETASTF